VISNTYRTHFNLGKTQYLFYRKLGEPQARSGRVENVVPAGIRCRTVQPVVIRYTDRATRSTPVLVVSEFHALRTLRYLGIRKYTYYEQTLIESCIFIG